MKQVSFGSAVFLGSFHAMSSIDLPLSHLLQESKKCAQLCDMVSRPFLSSCLPVLFFFLSILGFFQLLSFLFSADVTLRADPLASSVGVFLFVPRFPSLASMPCSVRPCLSRSFWLAFSAHIPPPSPLSLSQVLQIDPRNVKAFFRRGLSACLFG